MVEPFFAVEELAIGAPAWLPPRRPRVLAVEVGDPDGTLLALHDGLRRRPGAKARDGAAALQGALTQIEREFGKGT
jgi:hypothetical protein